MPTIKTLDILEMEVDGKLYYQIKGIWFIGRKESGLTVTYDTAPEQKLLSTIRDMIPTSRIR